MPEEYPIINLTEETLTRSARFESGAEQKYKIPWTQVDLDREQLAIFKIDNEPREVSRVWIEKLAGELAIAMGLPTATYEMCETEDNRRGIASPSYLKDGGVEQPGIVLMQEVFETNSVLYTVEHALTVFDRLDISLPSGYTPPPEIGTAKDLFIGYLLHSYWIDDPDFHARNWGIQINPDGERELLPNYDYGRALVDFPIVNNRLEIFAERLAGTRTCAFVNNDGKEIKMDEMVAILKRISPNITQYWSDRITQASAEQLNPICDLFPSGWGSPERIEFARIFINYNSQRLAQLTAATSQIVHAIDPPHPDEPPPNPPTPHNSPDERNSIATIENIASAYYNRAVLQGYNLDDIPGALANFNKAIKLNPQFANAYYSRAVLKLTKLNDVSGALIDLNEAILLGRGSANELNPQLADAYHHRANLKQTRLRNVAGALVDYDRAIELNPQSIDAYCNRAILKQFRLNDVPGALADFNKAIELNPQDGNIYYNRANLKQTKLDDLTGALADYDKAIELDSQYANAYYGRANLKQTKLDDIAGSILDFRAAATFYQQQGRLEDWEDTIERLEKIEGTT
jgi:tetratricopeptide (TPR) repeat protein